MRRPRLHPDLALFLGLLFWTATPAIAQTWLDDPPAGTRYVEFEHPTADTVVFQSWHLGENELVAVQPAVTGTNGVFRYEVIDELIADGYDAGTTHELNLQALPFAPDGSPLTQVTRNITATIPTNAGGGDSPPPNGGTNTDPGDDPDDSSPPPTATDEVPWIGVGDVTITLEGLGTMEEALTGSTRYDVWATNAALQHRVLTAIAEGFAAIPAPATQPDSGPVELPADIYTRIGELESAVDTLSTVIGDMNSGLTPEQATSLQAQLAAVIASLQDASVNPAGTQTVRVVIEIKGPEEAP